MGGRLDQGIPNALRRQELGSIIFTSGTTGPSKGVMMSHSQLHFFAEECVDLVRLTDSDIYMTANPLFHGNAQFVTVYPALIAGASVALYDKFSPSKWMDRIRESGATVTNSLGVMMEWIAKQPPQEKELDNHLRCIFAAPTAYNLVDTFRQRFGVKTFVEAYGQTETCMPIMTPYGAVQPQGAAGLAVSEWYEIRLGDDETDDEVATGRVGEIQLRPREPWILNSGYFGMPEATASARRNLWYHTGDGARKDQDGWYYFVDRLKDTIRRRGENISSYQIEQVFLRHPDVAECAAVGVPADEEAGEDEVEVWLVPSNDGSIEPEEVWSWAKERLPHFVVPRYVQVTNQLPTTPSGKVQKAKLRDAGVSGAWDRLEA
jgi:crotonobetaine/carnitine-CoA ligase